MNGRATPVVALAAGGTGGHVFPAQALAKELLARGHRVLLLTDARGGGFGRAVPGIEIETISAGRVDGGPVGKVRGIALLGLGLIQAGRLLRALSPDAVVGFGGYPSLPTMVAATRTRLATLIHEQNAVLGRANRLVADKVDRIATSFESVSAFRGDAGRLVHTGNPVRDEVAALREAPYPDETGRLHVVVTGGSQGARTIGRTVPKAIARLPRRLRERLAVTQQCRQEDLAEAAEVYAAAEVEAETAAFFDDLPARLARAHLAVTRAGASTVAELACIGRPAILVPYPHATDDHQTANAHAVEQRGAGWVIADADLAPEPLASRLAGLFAAPERLADAARSAHRLGRPDAARDLADAVESLMRAGRNGVPGGQPQGREQAA